MPTLGLIVRSDADAQTGILLIPNCRLDALESIVSAGAAVGAKAIATDRQRDFVNDDQQVGGGRPERTAQILPQDPAAEVHVRLRLDQANARVTDAAVGDPGLAILAPGIEMPSVGEVIDHPPPDVMAGARVSPSPPFPPARASLLALRPPARDRAAPRKPPPPPPRHHPGDAKRAHPPPSSYP